MLYGPVSLWSIQCADAVTVPHLTVWHCIKIAVENWASLSLFRLLTGPGEGEGGEGLKCPNFSMHLQASGAGFLRPTLHKNNPGTDRRKRDSLASTFIERGPSNGYHPIRTCFTLINRCEPVPQNVLGFNWLEEGMSRDRQRA